MILQFFKNNTLQAIVFLLLLMAGASYFLFKNETILFSGSIIPIDFSQIPFPFVWILLATQAALSAFLLNSLLVRVNLYERSSALPMFIFVLSYCTFPSPSAISGLMVLLMALMTMLREPGKQLSRLASFHTGLLLGLSALLYLPMVLAVLLLPIGVPVFGRYPLRNFIISLSAWLLPFVYAFSIMAISGNEALFIQRMSCLLDWEIPTTMHWGAKASVTLWGIIAFISAINFFRFSGRLKVVQRRSYVMFMILFCISLLILIVDIKKATDSFIIPATAIGVFINAMLFRFSNQKWVTAIIVLLILAALTPFF
jgi:hypothetical protein